MEKKFSWKAREGAPERKKSGWYWSVGILAVGGATASMIATNFLLTILLLLGGFAIMLAGSRPSITRQFALSERGVHIDTQIVPWNKVSRFALAEGEPVVLTLETHTLLGTTAIPLTDIDWREVQMELKNRNVEEVDSLDSIVESIARMLGI